MKAYAFPVPECPASESAWSLEIRDLRAKRGDSQRVTKVIRDSVVRSFPACRWQDTASAATPSVLIEIHHFTVSYDDGYWDSAAEWSVLARDSAGGTFTEFQAQGEVSRPNLPRSANNRKALAEAFEKAMWTTLAGLRALSPNG